MSQSKYIVIDGQEATGKSTILSMLARQLQAAGQTVTVVEESNGQEQSLSAHVIRELMRDPRYPMRTQTEVLLYNAARSESLQTVQEALRSDHICLADQSYLTALVTQYYGRGDVPDYSTINSIINFALGDAQPDLIILLDAPVSTLIERINADAQSNHRPRPDEAFMERIRAGYLWEAKQRGIPVVYATEPLDTVFKQVWSYASELLELKPEDSNISVSEPTSVAQILADKPVTKASDVEPPLLITPAEHESPAKALQVEPASTEQAAKPQSTAVVSNLLATELQQIPDMQCNEQPSHNMAYEAKDAAGHYRYYLPDTIRGKLRSQYIRGMNQLFDAYAQLLDELTDYMISTATTPKATRNAAWRNRMRAQARTALRPILPAAATVDVEITVDSTIWEKLLSDRSVEARTMARQIVGAEESASGETSANQPSADFVSLINQLLPANHTPHTTGVTLANHVPRNELDSVVDILYPYGDLPLQVLRADVAGWPYQNKLDTFSTYLAGGTALGPNPLNKIFYDFDVVCSNALFRDLQADHLITDYTTQSLSPRLGYDMPELIEEAGLSDAFDDCFDISLQLYSTLQTEYPLEARYATLLGHKLRWRVRYTALEISKLHTQATPQTSGRSYYDLLSEMYEKIGEVHPLLSETLLANRQVPQHANPSNTVA